MVTICTHNLPSPQKFNQTYKDRVSNLTNMVLVMFEYDTMVQPKESEWFGFYKEGQDKETYTLYDSKIWQQVRE